MNLSENEQEVLKKLLLNARSSDSVIAKELGISSVAIAKIRKKLEVKGYVLGYSAKLDFKKIGLNYFALFYVKLTPLGYNLMNKLNFEKIKNLSYSAAVNIIKTYHIEYDFFIVFSLNIVQLCFQCLGVGNIK
jgi:DNA-binding Lrp family transcriptional regulator